MEPSAVRKEPQSPTWSLQASTDSAVLTPIRSPNCRVVDFGLPCHAPLYVILFGSIPSATSVLDVEVSTGMPRNRACEAFL